MYGVEAVLVTMVLENKLLVIRDKTDAVVVWREGGVMNEIRGTIK